MDVAALSAAFSAAFVTAAGNAAADGAERAATPDALAALPAAVSAAVSATAPARAAGAAKASGEGSASARSAGDSVTLSPEARAQLARLQASDTAVRAHEQAHLAAAGGIVVSGPVYVYQKGPDGRSYAVGGEVQIEVSPGRTPDETIARAARIEAAALAPADPSSADLAVAAQARRMAQQAEGERAAALRERATADGGVSGLGSTASGPSAPDALYRAIAGTGGSVDAFA